MLGVRKIKQTDLISPRWSALLEQQEAHPFRGVKVISPWRGWGHVNMPTRELKLLFCGLAWSRVGWFLQLELNGQAGGWGLSHCLWVGTIAQDNLTQPLMF